MDRDALAELFSAYGPVSARRMFSGYGLYSEDVCFGLVLRGAELYLKADKETFARFEAESCAPFSYIQPSTGKAVSVNSFRRMPERLYDDPEKLAAWTRAAIGAAHRAQLAKRRRADGPAAPKAGAKTQPRGGAGRRSAKAGVNRGRGRQAT